MKKRYYRNRKPSGYGYKPRRVFHDVYQETTDRMIKLLETGRVPWEKPWTGTDRPTNLYTGKPFRGSNIFLLAFSGYESNYWLGFGQAKKLGGYVREGERSTKILRWNVKVVTDRETGETTGSYMYPLFLDVYNSEQCNGLKVPELESFRNDPIETAERIISNMPRKPEIIHGNGGANYNPRTDFVTVPGSRMFPDINEYYSTLYHELVHATGHASRLNRLNAFGNRFGSPDYAREELIAETGAAFLCAASGIEKATERNAVAYCQHWIDILRGDKRLFIQAASGGQRAASYILNEAETTE